MVKPKTTTTNAPSAKRWMTFKKGGTNIKKPAIRRLARRAGVKRLSGLVYNEARGVFQQFLEQVLEDAITYTEYRKGKTVSEDDIHRALARQGRKQYG